MPPRYPRVRHFESVGGVVLSKSVLLSRLGGLRRVIVLLLAVTGILIGLLAMHTFTAGPSGPSLHQAAEISQELSGTGIVEHAALPTEASMAPVGAHGMVPPDCNGMCDSEHNMAGMVCLLALLITTLILIVRVVIARWAITLRRLVGDLAEDLFATRAPPSPPSLLTLSISRT